MKWSKNSWRNIKETAIVAVLMLPLISWMDTDTDRGVAEFFVMFIYAFLVWFSTRELRERIESIIKSLNRY